MIYTFSFPANIELSVHGSTANEELAYSDAIVAIRKALEDVKGVRISPIYRGGKVTDRQPDEDPR